MLVVDLIKIFFIYLIFGFIDYIYNVLMVSLSNI